MRILQNYRWAGLLLIIGAVSVVLVPPLEKFYKTEGCVPSFLFSSWFFCNTAGMIGLSFFYSSAGNKRAGWINFIGLICLYAFWVMIFAGGYLTTIAWIGIGIAFILMALSAYISKEIPLWVVVVWLLASVTAMTSQILPRTSLFEAINFWNLGLGVAAFGSGYSLWRQEDQSKQEEL